MIQLKKNFENGKFPIPSLMILVLEIHNMKKIGYIKIIDTLVLMPNLQFKSSMDFSIHYIADI